MPFTLKPQQQKIFDELISRDSGLVVLKTGGGKTIIALKLIEYLLAKKPGLKVLFLAPTNVLITQHFETLSSCFDVKLVTPLSMKKINVVPEAQVKICTGHYAAILAKQNLLNDISLIIYDEAHRGTSSTSSYATVAKILKAPFRFGFTASPGTIKAAERIKKNLQLETQIRGSSPFKFKRALKATFLPLRPLLVQAAKLIKAEINRKCVYCAKSLKSPIPTISDATYLILQKEKIKRILKENNISLYEYYTYFFYTYYYEQVLHESYTTLLKTLNKSKFKLNPTLLKRLELLKTIPPSKYLYLLGRLLKLRAKKDSKTLVFFENYQTCLDFKNFLTSRGLIDSEIVVVAGKSKMTPKERTKKLEKATLASEVKIILATSVLEEGVNLDVDIVFCFKPIANLTRFIQREGRTGRYRDGTIETLVYEGTYEVNILKKLIETSQMTFEVTTLKPEDLKQ